MPGEAGQPVTLGVGVGERGPVRVHRTERQPVHVRGSQRVCGSFLVAEPELSGGVGCA